MAKFAFGIAAAAALSVTVSSAAASDQCLAMPDALRLSLDYDPRIDRAKADREIARANMQAAGSRHLPQLSVFGQTGLGDTPPLDRRRDDQLGLQLNHELFSFGNRRYATEAAQAQYRAAKLGVGEAEQNIAQGIAGAYLDVARAHAISQIADEQVASYARDAEAAESRLQRNVITLTEASQIRARYAVAQSDAIQAAVEVEASLARLSVLIGQDVTCLDDASIPTFVGQGAAELLRLDPDAAVDRAMDRSIALRRTKAQKAAARASINEANRANMPVVSLSGFALYEFNAVGDEFLNRGQTTEGDSRIGLSLRQDLYTGGRNAARRADARARLQGAQADENLQKIVVEDLVKRALARARAQQQAGLALLEASEFAKIQLDNTTKEYRRGTKTLTDLVIANEAYFTAAEQETQARYAFYNSLVQLYSAMGQLTDPVQ